MAETSACLKQICSKSPDSAVFPTPASILPLFLFHSPCFYLDWSYIPLLFTTNFCVPQRSATVAISASARRHAREERQAAACACARAVTASQSHASVRTSQSASVLQTAASAPNVVSRNRYTEDFCRN